MADSAAPDASSADGQPHAATAEANINGEKYEYLDHTADVQIHSWGDSLAEAFEQAAIAMGGYQTEMSSVEELKTERVEANAHDLISLLYSFMDEVLFLFCADPFFIAKRIKILEFDEENFSIVAEMYGETFDLSKHPQGTEVKAITFSNMQIFNSPGNYQCYVIIDI